VVEAGAAFDAPACAGASPEFSGWGGDSVKRSRLSRLTAAAGLGALLLLTACGGAAAPSSTAKATGTPAATASSAGPSTVTIFQTTDPNNDFNPLITSSAYDGDITGLIYDDLLSLNDKLGYVPWMATYDIGDNGKQITFHLKPGIKFQDGTVLTSKDVAATFEFIFNPDYPGPLLSNYTALKGGQKYADALNKLIQDATPPKGGGAAKITHDQFEAQAQPLYKAWLQGGAIQTPDDQTVVFNLDSVYAPILQYLGLTGIEEAKQIDALTTPDQVANADKADFSTHPVGTGPYAFVKHQTGQFTELQAFPGYWQGAPKIQQVIFKVADQNQEVGLLQKGDVDAVGFQSSQINPQDTQLLQKIPGVQGWEYPQFGYQFMVVNMLQPRFQDVRVRQAIAYAIDRKGIVDKLLAGHGTVMNAPFSPASWAYPSTLTSMYPYDPAKAKDLLQQAGWTLQNGVLTKGGDTLTFTLDYPGGSSNPVRQQSAPLIQDNLNAVGMKVSLQPLDFNTLVSKLLNKTTSSAKDYDASLLGWSAAIDPDTTGMYGATDLYNLSHWNATTAGADAYNQSMKLTSDGAATFDQTQRQQIYQQLAQLYANDLPWIYLYSQNQQSFADARFQGMIKDARGPLFEGTAQNWTLGGAQ
jgi:peptide/nickel transport system substrate-binding protein